MVSTNFVIGVLCGVLGLIAITSILPPAQSVPPTPAFSTIIIDGQTYTATRFDDTLVINTKGEVITERPSPNENSVIFELAPVSCPLLQNVHGVDADGNLICAV